MMEVMVTIGAVRRAVKMSPPTNQHPVFYRMPFLSLNQQCQSTEGFSLSILTGILQVNLG